jgi:hypothetical protein
MAALAEDYPDFRASFVLSRKGTPLLMDAHNHKYRIHSNNTDKTIIVVSIGKKEKLDVL